MLPTSEENHGNFVTIWFALATFSASNVKLFYTNNTDPHYCIEWVLGVNTVKYIFFDALTTITPDEIGVDHTMVGLH